MARNKKHGILLLNLASDKFKYRILNYVIMTEYEQAAAITLDSQLKPIL